MTAGSPDTTNYLYGGTDLLEEIDNSGNVLARYTGGINVDESLAEFRSGTASYHEQDGIGSATSLTNSSGAVANTYVYDSFGKLITSTGTLTNPLRYVAREFDAETTAYYYRARYYDQNIGRFVSEDPIGFSGGLNFYAYVGGNPVNYADPLGTTGIPIRIWGWWCGPNWTGGHYEQYDPAHDNHGYYHEPWGATDRVCKEHDICYYRCRHEHPCDWRARSRCMRDICDATLIYYAPQSGAGPWIAFGIDILNEHPDPGKDDKGCPPCKRSSGGHK